MLYNLTYCNMVKRVFMQPMLYNLLYCNMLRSKSVFVLHPYSQPFLNYVSHLMDTTLN